MKLKLKKYKEQLQDWPEKGHHIMAQYDDEKIIVHQSYRKEIGNFAVKNQYFGGAFSLERMTWIKPNFLWMMYRNGWGRKDGQESVLAIHLKMDAFKRYLENAVYSSYNERLEISREEWQNQVKESSVRLQWDPDHDPFGNKLERRAIQIGLRNEFIKTFAKEDILLIEDISEFVKEQHQFVLNDDLDQLILPEEKPLLFDDEDLNKKIKVKIMKDKLLLASKSLTGISIGDAFGESFFGEESLIKTHIHKRIIPESSLDFTDDTIMAIAIFKSLEKFGEINQNFLAEEFTKNYYLDINRGYGPSMHQYFRAVKSGEHWKNVSYSKFEGQGSMGNGGAMRAAVIGAYFYDDLIQLKRNAELSCEVTHANKEAIEGTKAIALATAFTVQEKLGLKQLNQQDFIQKIQNELDDSDMKSKLSKALYLDGNPSIELLVKTLGNGIKMTAQDTVPIVIWMLSRYRNNFEECLWNSVSALGDRDTICAISGGISIVCCDENTLPNWIKNVENWKNSKFYEN